MLQSFAALFGALFTSAACYATGILLLRRTGWRKHLLAAEEVPLAVLLGAACVHLLMFAIFTAQAAYWPVIVGAPALLILAAVLGKRGPRLVDSPAHLTKAETWTATIVAGAFLVTYVVNAWAPESSADGSAYHLGLLARYLRAHGFERVTTNMYAALGGGVEMVFAPAFVIGRHSAAALTHLCFAAALATAVFVYGKRIGHARAGLAAAVLLWVTPVFGRDATFAYVDVGAAAAVFATFYWLEIWIEKSDDALLWPVGLMAGYAFAAKFTGITILAFAAITVLLRSRHWQKMIPLLGGAAVMATPCLVRNWIWYGNPLAPLANAYFPNPYFHIAAQDDWAAWLRHYDLKSLWQIPLELTTNGISLQGLLGPLFLLAPVALLAIRSDVGRRVLAAGAFVLLTYPANIGTRFLIPALPFVLLGFTLALKESKVLLLVAMLAHGVASWPDVTDLYARYTWRIYLFPWRAALRLDSQDVFLNRYFPAYRVARMIEGNVPKGESVFALNGTADAYTSREIRVYFQSASNWDLTDIFNMGWDPASQPLIGEMYSVGSTSAQGVRVVEELASPHQWSVHELRLLRDGQELSPKPEWRLRSEPNPWQVGLAFDNSPVTRWRTWQATPAGSTIEAMFGGTETFDEVRVITSPDYAWTRVKLQVNRSGTWQAIDVQPKIVELGEPRQVRREAVRELTRRGIHFILMQPGDTAYTDVAEDPEGWGLRQVANTGGAVLYRTIW